MAIANKWYSLHQHLFDLASFNIELYFVIVEFKIFSLESMDVSDSINCKYSFLCFTIVKTVSALNNFVRDSFPIRQFDIILNKQLPSDFVISGE